MPFTETQCAKPFIAKEYMGPGAGVKYPTKSVYHRLAGFTAPEVGVLQSVATLCNIQDRRDWTTCLNAYSHRKNVPAKDRCGKCEQMFTEQTTE